MGKMPQTIRAFIALELPTVIIRWLDDVQRGFKSSGLGAKWVKPENIHLTLKFLGNIDSGAVDDIDKAMTEAVKGCAPLSLTARGVGVFPGLKRPRVVWVGLGGNIQPLFAMQCRLEEHLAAIGFAKEKRPFKGHLTIGRFRQDVNPHAISRIIQEHANLETEPFTAYRIILFQSDLQPAGPVYSKRIQVTLE